jgi:hypothetical protein
MAKSFKLPREQLRPLAKGLGSCIASDLILVDGHRVGYMYREAPDNNIDSGWRFFAGQESQDYADNPDNFCLYDVNTVANYDPEIIPLLSAPEGSAFERRDGVGPFTAIDFEPEE